jgi:hypothetical protein
MFVIYIYILLFIYICVCVCVRAHAHVFLRIAGDLRFWARNVNLQLVKAAANLMDTTVYGDWWQRLERA